jgi:hypothetical protein
MLNRIRSGRSVLGAILVVAAAVAFLLVSLPSVRSALISTTLGSLVRAGRGSDLNLLVITLDTTRADAIGAYGGRAVTPTLDQLADTGVMFEQTSLAPATLPAHSSLYRAVSSGSRERQALASKLPRSQNV